MLDEIRMASQRMPGRVCTAGIKHNDLYSFPSNMLSSPGWVPATEHWRRLEIVITSRLVDTSPIWWSITSPPHPFQSPHNQSPVSLIASTDMVIEHLPVAKLTVLYLGTLRRVTPRLDSRTIVPAAPSRRWSLSIKLSRLLLCIYPSEATHCPSACTS